MVTEKRRIEAGEVLELICNNCPDHIPCPVGGCAEFIRISKLLTADAVEVVHGWWKGYVHSALVRWKDGEPVWADRNVYRCSRCDYGTIAKHNYCPRCGAKMDGERKDND